MSLISLQNFPSVWLHLPCSSCHFLKQICSLLFWVSVLYCQGCLAVMNPFKHLLFMVVSALGKRQKFYGAKWVRTWRCAVRSLTFINWHMVAALTSFLFLASFLSYIIKKLRRTPEIPGFKKWQERWDKSVQSGQEHYKAV